MRGWTVGAAALAAMAMLPTSAVGGPGLSEMLRMTPPEAATDASMPFFAYIDFRALEAAAGVPTPQSEDVFAKAPDADKNAWIGAMMRIGMGPRSVIEQIRNVGRRERPTAEALGFDWFAIDRALAILDAPPKRSTWLSGSEALSDPMNLDYALPRRGFIVSEVDGVSVWHRFQDDALASALTDQFHDADPFLDEFLLKSTRIVVRPGLLAAASNWPDTYAVLDGLTGKTAPPPAAAVSAAMVDAVRSAVGGEPIQASAYFVSQVGAVDQTGKLLQEFLANPGSDLGTLAKDIAPAEAGPPLAPYPLLLMADFQVGADQVGVLAVPYAERRTADEAAAVLGARFRDWRPGGMEKPVVAGLGGTVETSVVDIPDGAADTMLSFGAMANAGPIAPDKVDEVRSQLAGKPASVAIVTIRYPLPAKGEGRPGRLWQTITAAIFNRDFAPLATP